MRRSTYLPLALVALPALLTLGCGREPVLHLGKTLDEWTEQLSSTDRLDRLSAIRSLGDIARRQPGDSQVVSELVKAIDHEDRAVRYWAVRSIGDLDEGVAGAANRLAKALEDPAPEVRIWAAYALCRQGRESAGMPILIGELQNPNGPARLHAAHALEALGEEARPAVDALKGVLNDEYGYPGRVAERTLKTLGEMPVE